MTPKNNLPVLNKKEMKKYKCNKCGQEADEVPKEHGFLIFNGNIEREICNGKFELNKIEKSK